MSTVVENFLKTEAAANALVDELTQLKAEIQRYGTAAVTLVSAGRSLDDLAGVMSNLADGSRGVILALKEIGTPHLLEGLGNLSERYTEHAVQLRSLDDLIRQSIQQIAAASGTIETLGTNLGNGQIETGNCLSQLLLRTDHLGTAVIACDRKIDSALSSVDSLGSNLLASDRKVDAVCTALTQIQLQADNLGATIAATGAKVEALAAATQRQLQALATENVRLLQSSRMANWSAAMAFLSSIGTLIYLLVIRR